ncbi:DUF7507 domain-containing protein [Sphingobacterium hungaricum]|uniref:Chromophore lyase n=1 Tax=Sphingobacterium hungaricum TaxID=2082723 RepID=A0A928UVF8_9SPHI|nr:Ig-like domain-containing protein [Sphingobacterium hungaricum]MBE8712623.1 chromophore lyase [Sphingobacterium hungaricum]
MPKFDFWIIVCLITLLLFARNAKAEGSKDLYPLGVSGNRAFLVSGHYSLSSTSFPFVNYGEHYAYVKPGEVLAVASSAQGIGSGYIRLTNPSGVVITTQGTSDGIIGNTGSGTRSAELAGPRIGYTPFEIVIDGSNAGIWKVEFIPPSDMPDESNRSPASVLADSDWEQNQYNNFIAAWDISVFNPIINDWTDGRVYTNILNLQINAGPLSNSFGAFYGQNYVMTNDGYIYRVKGNGSNGIAFSYFVNNKGYLDINDEPLYKSVNSSRLGDFNIQDPRGADGFGQVTHKMMYNLPNADLPELASGAAPGGSTWLLKKDRETAVVGNIRIVGLEGTEDFVSSRGSNIYFETNLEATYKITVASADELMPFEPATLIVSGKDGLNQVYWNGKDGNGVLLPAGEQYAVTIKVELLGGEVHFPYIDMEINPNGIIIELLNDNLIDVESDIVYWDDNDISPGAPGESSDPITNLTGISSNLNGHRWGSYRDQTTNFNSNGNYGGFSFGNERSMDTWAYALSIDETATKEITVKVADLEIESVITSQTTIELGETVIYEVKVVNNGPSDITGALFNFTLPEGFQITDVKHESDCAILNRAVIRSNSYQTQIDLTNGCGLTFTFSAVANYPVPDGTYGQVEAYASILRPIDTTDPDATSNSLDVNSTRTAADECENNGLGVGCNNIKLNTDAYLLELLNERGSLTLLKEAMHLDDNGDRFKQVGEVIQYIFTIKNNGFVAVDDLVLADLMLSSNPISLAQTSLAVGEEIQVVVNYTITQADFDKGFIENTALVSGKNPRKFDVKDISGTAADNDDRTLIVIEKKPVLRLKKSVLNIGTGTGGYFTVDDELIYKLEIYHSGEIAVEDLKIEDLKISSEIIVPDRQTIKNENITTELRYIVTNEDVDRGYVENTASVYGIEELFGTQISDISGLTVDDDLPTRVSTPTRAKAIDDEEWMYQNNSKSFKVLSNDIKGSGVLIPSSVRVLTPPSNGTAISRVDGSILYEPNTDFVGGDFLTYQVADENRLWSTEATLFIDVRQTNPIAVVDYFETWYNRAVELAITLNDSVPGATIDLNSIEVLRYPQHGSAVILPNGIVHYTPFSNFTGTDDFIYRVKDSNGWYSNEATVTILTKGFFIPNTFTPNGDGKNDTFFIIGAYMFDRIQLEVINRHGKLMYRSDDYKNDWSAEGLSDGTYYFIVNGHSADGKSYNNKGTVTIIRSLNY